MIPRLSLMMCGNAFGYGTYAPNRVQRRLLESLSSTTYHVRRTRQMWGMALYTTQLMAKVGNTKDRKQFLKTFGPYRRDHLRGAQQDICRVMHVTPVLWLALKSNSTLSHACNPWRNARLLHGCRVIKSASRLAAWHLTITTSLHVPVRCCKIRDIAKAVGAIIKEAPFDFSETIPTPN